MARRLDLFPDRLFLADAEARDLTRALHSDPPVADPRLQRWKAVKLAQELTGGLARRANRLDHTPIAAMAA